MTGWIDRRKAGGAHSIRMPSKPLALAHQFCLDREIEKRDRTGQASLF